MTPIIKIELSPKAEKIVASYQTLPARLVQAVARGMDKANEYAKANIEQKHLTGKGPFPPAEHKLGVRSGLLRKMAYASPAQQITATTVQSAIGAAVKYAAIHEFGGRIHREPRQMTIRHKTDARGNLVTRTLSRLSKSGVVTSPNSMLIFAKAGAKRVRETVVQSKAHDINMPERAPFRTGLAESREIYNLRISSAIVAEWKAMGS